MRAAAAIRAELVGGRTRLVALRSDPPLTVRATPAGEAACVHLVGSAAGPLGGDELAIGVEVGPGAELTVRSAAASLAQPGPAGAPSSLIVVVRVGAGGCLRWCPEPLVAVRGCDHRTSATVDLASDARLEWREELVAGRHGEDPGRVRARLQVDRGGRPLHRGELAIGQPGWDGPAGTDGARAVGSLLAVGGSRPEPIRPPGVRAAALQLAEDATLTLALADRPGALRAFLDSVVSAGS